MSPMLSDGVRYLHTSFSPYIFGHAIMSELSITLVQADLAWEDPKTNRDMLEEQIVDTNGTDLIVLPEMFTTGFTMAPERVAEESASSETLAWMKAIAHRHDAVITGSVAIQSEGDYYNRLYWVTPKGEVSWYDKRHLFRMGEEGKHYQSGAQQVTVSLKGFNIRLGVCYDLRFPVWNRNIDKSYDLLLYVASWPSARRHAWQTLLKARAIENQCYVVGVNRCGTDGNGLYYTGDSMLLDFLGEELVSEPIPASFVRTGVIGKEVLDDYRAKFPAWKDADSFVLK